MVGRWRLHVCVEIRNEKKKKKKRRRMCVTVTALALGGWRFGKGDLYEVCDGRYRTYE